MITLTKKQISKVHSTFGRNYSPATVLKNLQKKYGDIDFSSIDENSFFQQRKIARKIITTPTTHFYRSDRRSKSSIRA